MNTLKYLAGQLGPFLRIFLRLKLPKKLYRSMGFSGPFSIFLNNQKKNFIKAINDLRHNKKLYNSLSNGAYKKFIEKFQLKNTNRKYIDLIKSL